MQREVIESEMHFLGFLIMENFLKEETTPTIQALQKANVKTIMATGDNGLTALSVGKQCGIIKSDIPIFLGELIETGKQKHVEWNNVEM